MVLKHLIPQWVGALAEADQPLSALNRMFADAHPSALIFTTSDEASLFALNCLSDDTLRSLILDDWAHNRESVLLRAVRCSPQTFYALLIRVSRIFPDPALFMEYPGDKAQDGGEPRHGQLRVIADMRDPYASQLTVSNLLRSVSPNGETVYSHIVANHLRTMSEQLTADAESVYRRNPACAYGQIAVICSSSVHQSLHDNACVGMSRILRSPYNCVGYPDSLFLDGAAQKSGHIRPHLQNAWFRRPNERLERAVTETDRAADGTSWEECLRWWWNEPVRAAIHTNQESLAVIMVRDLLVPDRALNEYDCAGQTMLMRAAGVPHPGMPRLVQALLDRRPALDPLARCLPLLFSSSAKLQPLTDRAAWIASAAPAHRCFSARDYADNNVHLTFYAGSTVYSTILDAQANHLFSYCGPGTALCDTILADPVHSICLPRVLTCFISDYAFSTIL
jgi:hypothetical protein